MAIYSLFGKNGGMERVDVPANHIKNNLPLGSVCLFAGYGDHKYVIVKNNGINDSFPEYGAQYVLVNVDDYRTHITNAMNIKPVSEKFGIGVYLLDEPIKSADEVLDLWEKSKQAEEYAKRAKAEKDEHESAVIAALPSKYPHLTPVKGSGKPDRVMGAKNIRTELKKAFPGVKFSITSDSYSGGNSIDVSWTDGPTSERVEKITGKYQQGSFDGMTDCYNYDNGAFSYVFGGAKYVMEQRSCSKEAYNKTAEALGYPEAKMGDQGQFVGVDYEINEMIKRETWKRSF